MEYKKKVHSSAGMSSIWQYNNHNDSQQSTQQIWLILTCVQQHLNEYFWLNKLGQTRPHWCQGTFLDFDWSHRRSGSVMVHGVCGSTWMPLDNCCYPPPPPSYRSLGSPSPPRTWWADLACPGRLHVKNRRIKQKFLYNSLHYFNHNFFNGVWLFCYTFNLMSITYYRLDYVFIEIS